MTVSRIGFWLLCLLLLLGNPLLASGQEGVFLKEEDAPGAVFPDANSFERSVIPSSEELKQKIGVALQTTTLMQNLTCWEILDLFASFYEKSVSPDVLLRRMDLEQPRADAR